jgi:hypothetical protein
MNLIVKHLAGNNNFNWPVPNSTLLIEDNIGEELAIHVHLGGGEPSAIHGMAHWALRLHFTYQEFLDFCDAIEEGGEL